jgi:hypothetical protein
MEIKLRRAPRLFVTAPVLPGRTGQLRGGLPADEPSACRRCSRETAPLLPSRIDSIPRRPSSVVLLIGRNAVAAGGGLMGEKIR